MAAAHLGISRERVYNLVGAGVLVHRSLNGARGSHESLFFDRQAVENLRQRRHGITVAEAARRLGIKERQVRQLIQDGVLSGHNTGTPGQAYAVDAKSIIALERKKQFTKEFLEDHMTISEFAEQMGISLQAANKWRKTGLIPFITLEKGMLFDTEIRSLYFIPKALFEQRKDEWRRRIKNANIRQATAGQEQAAKRQKTLPDYLTDYEIMLPSVERRIKAAKARRRALLVRGEPEDSPEIMQIITENNYLVERRRALLDLIKKIRRKIRQQKPEQH
ncbi:MAG: hypothetical protein HY394_01995 [Candidatus Diapherotrites archaeon]|nr:hypothetical protein [Candidatus Diapherotrites archaeon]